MFSLLSLATIVSSQMNGGKIEAVQEAEFLQDATQFKQLTPPDWKSAATIYRTLLQNNPDDQNIRKLYHEALAARAMRAAIDGLEGHAEFDPLPGIYKDCQFWVNESSLQYIHPKLHAVLVHHINLINVRLETAAPIYEYLLMKKIAEILKTYVLFLYFDERKNRAVINVGFKRNKVLNDITYLSDIFTVDEDFFTKPRAGMIDDTDLLDELDEDPDLDLELKLEALTTPGKSKKITSEKNVSTKLPEEQEQNIWVPQFLINSTPDLGLNSSTCGLWLFGKLDIYDVFEDMVFHGLIYHSIFQSLSMLSEKHEIFPPAIGQSAMIPLDCIKIELVPMQAGYSVQSIGENKFGKVQPLVVSVCPSQPRERSEFSQVLNNLTKNYFSLALILNMDLSNRKNYLQDWASVKIPNQIRQLDIDVIFSNSSCVNDFEGFYGASLWMNDDYLFYREQLQSGELFVNFMANLVSFLNKNNNVISLNLRCGLKNTKALAENSVCRIDPYYFIREQKQEEAFLEILLNNYSLLKLNLDNFFQARLSVCWGLSENFFKKIKKNFEQHNIQCPNSFTNGKDVVEAIMQRNQELAKRSVKVADLGQINLLKQCVEELADKSSISLSPSSANQDGYGAIAAMLKKEQSKIKMAITGINNFMLTPMKEPVVRKNKIEDIGKIIEQSTLCDKKPAVNQSIEWRGKECFSGQIQNLREQIASANELLGQGELDLALAACNGIFDNAQPKSTEYLAIIKFYHENIACLKANENDSVAQLNDFKQQLAHYELVCDFPDLYLLRARIYYEKNDFKMAMKNFRMLSNFEDYANAALYSYWLAMCDGVKQAVSDGMPADYGLPALKGLAPGKKFCECNECKNRLDTETLTKLILEQLRVAGLNFTDIVDDLHERFLVQEIAKIIQKICQVSEKHGHYQTAVLLPYKSSSARVNIMNEISRAIKIALVKAYEYKYEIKNVKTSAPAFTADELRELMEAYENEIQQVRPPDSPYPYQQLNKF